DRGRELQRHPRLRALPDLRRHERAGRVDHTDRQQRLRASNGSVLYIVATYQSAFPFAATLPLSARLHDDRVGAVHDGSRILATAVGAADEAPATG
ncbi:MAG TPA: hypothetical protein VKA45_08825, partial [Gaiellaceae bacterium]|nr:hypothetical protein [Gaiellaceae bacterium]